MRRELESPLMIVGESEARQITQSELFFTRSFLHTTEMRHLTQLFSTAMLETGPMTICAYHHIHTIPCV